MAWVSVASMVVWFTTPMRCRSFTGLKPGVARSPKISVKRPMGSSPEMMRPSNRASSMSFTITAGAPAAVWLNVARVSSCAALPWITTV